MGEGTSEDETFQQNFRLSIMNGVFVTKKEWQKKKALTQSLAWSLGSRDMWYLDSRITSPGKNHWIRTYKGTGLGSINHLLKLT